MTEQPAPPPGSIPGVHITHCVSTKISQDGQTAMVIFQITENGGIQFAVTLPVAGLGTLLGMVADLRRLAESRNLDPGMVKAQQPGSFAIGNSPLERGCIFLIFDGGTEHEISLRVLDADAINLAQMIERDVLSRWTTQAQAEYARKARPLLVPTGGKLILPNGRN